MNLKRINRFVGNGKHLFTMGSKEEQNKGKEELIILDDSFPNYLPKAERSKTKNWKDSIIKKLQDKKDNNDLL